MGNPSPRVREKLWEMAVKRTKDGNVIQLWTARNPQGFDYRQYGSSDHFLVDFDGLALVAKVLRQKKEKSLRETN